MRSPLRECRLVSQLCLVSNGLAGITSVAGRRTFATTRGRQASYGFIGLGRMGYPMAANLQAKISKDDTLYIFDRNTEATSDFLQEAGNKGESKGGAVIIASGPREVAEKSSTIITALPEPAHVTSVFHSILSSPLPKRQSTAAHCRLFIDTSTIDPGSSRSVADAVHSTRSGRFVDAPMSGGVVGARAGTLTFMVGCTSQPEVSSSTPVEPGDFLIDRITHVLLHLGKRVQHLGPQGSGLAAKLANNYLLAVSNIATAEAMNMGVKLGLNPQKLGELINSSSGRCWSSEVNNPVPGVSKGAPAERSYDGGFGVALMRKDLRLAMEAARECGARLELGKKTQEVYEETEKREGAKDFSVVYKWLGGL